MRKWILICFSLMFSAMLTAQELRIAPGWTTAVPIGETSKYVNATSARGFQFEVDQFINDRWSFGGNFGWQAFFQKDFKMYLEDQSIISGVQRNYINALILMFTSRYYFPNSVNKVRAYVAIDIGTAAIENYEIFGTHQYKELLWHFAIAPGVGVDIPIVKNLGIQVYFKYHNSFKSQNSAHYSWIQTGIGLYVNIPKEEQ